MKYKDYTGLNSSNFCLELRSKNGAILLPKSKNKLSNKRRKDKNIHFRSDRHFFGCLKPLRNIRKKQMAIYGGKKI